MRFLLDTTTCSAHLRQHPLVYQKMEQHRGQLAISAITWAELHTWAIRSNAASRRLKLQQLIQDVTFLPVDDVIAETYGTMRARFLNLGKPVPELDSIIAATALVNQLIVVTNNTKDFKSIPGLTLQDWTMP